MINKIHIHPAKQKLIIYVILTVATLAVFWQVMHCGFINYDDGFYITENSNIKSGITPGGISWAFSTRYSGLWTPLVWVSFMMDYQLYGMNAGGYHLTNLILHVLSTLLIFLLFSHMTAEIWKSAFVAALFALHPLHVESVAWVAERKDVLSAFFWMLTLCLYAHYAEKPVIKRYLLVICSFILALLSKPMVVTLPVVMILLDYWPLKRFESHKDDLILWQLKEKAPFFLLSAVFAAITLYDQIFSLDDNYHYSLGSRIANAPVAFMTYLEKTLLPHDMAIFYPFTECIPIWPVIGATLFIILISVAVIKMVKRLPYLFVGWAWYAATILPVIGIIQIGPHLMADRYHYLPSIGIAVMMAWGIPLLLLNENSRKWILFPAAIGFLAVLSFLTWKQCGYWKNSITLFNHALQVTEYNFLAHDNLAAVLIHEGKYEEAFNHTNRSISITPDNYLAYLNRGLIYSRLGQYQLAIENYNRAIHFNPVYDKAYLNRGIAYGELDQHRLAIDDLKKAVKINPAHVYFLNDRGTHYADLGRYQQAVEYYNEAIRIQPDNAFFYNNRGAACLSQGNKEQGCRDAYKGCELGQCTTLIISRGRGDCP
jgi:regulator of sirC expression with transglutaminase-like and TPR domain